MFSQKKNNNQINKIIPVDQISYEDIEKLLVRSALICAHIDVQKQYRHFIEPLALDYQKGGTRNIKEELLFAGFFNALKTIQEVYQEKYEKEKTIALISLHKNDVVQLALEYCDRAENMGISNIIFPQLKTIAKNIKSREPVLHYSISRRRSYGTC